MRTKYTVKLKTIVEEHKLHPLHTSADYEKAVLTTTDVNRPAMQLTGFYNYFDPHRLQIIGRVESTYLDTLTHEQRLDALERFMPTRRCRVTARRKRGPSRTRTPPPFRRT